MCSIQYPAHHFTRQSERHKDRSRRDTIALLTKSFNRHSCHVPWPNRTCPFAKALFSSTRADKAAGLTPPIARI